MSKNLELKKQIEDYKGDMWVKFDSIVTEINDLRKTKKIEKMNEKEKELNFDIFIKAADWNYLYKQNKYVIGVGGLIGAYHIWTIYISIPRFSKKNEKIDEIFNEVWKKQKYEKPIELFKKIINHYTSTTDIIYDLFLHSGTTLIASEIMGRRCIGIEIDPFYCDYSVNRYIQFCIDNNIKYSVKLNGKKYNPE